MAHSAARIIWNCFLLSDLNFVGLRNVPSLWQIYSAARVIWNCFLFSSEGFKTRDFLPGESACELPSEFGFKAPNGDVDADAKIYCFKFGGIELQLQMALLLRYTWCAISHVIFSAKWQGGNQCQSWTQWSNFLFPLKSKFAPPPVNLVATFQNSFLSELLHVWLTVCNFVKSKLQPRILKLFCSQHLLGLLCSRIKTKQTDEYYSSHSPGSFALSICVEEIKDPEFQFRLCSLSWGVQKSCAFSSGSVLFLCWGVQKSWISVQALFSVCIEEFKNSVFQFKLCSLFVLRSSKPLCFSSGFVLCAEEFRDPEFQFGLRSLLVLRGSEVLRFSSGFVLCVEEFRDRVIQFRKKDNAFRSMRKTETASFSSGRVCVCVCVCLLTWETIPLLRGESAHGSHKHTLPTSTLSTNGLSAHTHQGESQGDSELLIFHSRQAWIYEAHNVIVLVRAYWECPLQA